MKKKIKVPIAILWAFWNIVIYCTIDGTWWYKEIEGTEVTQTINGLEL